VCALSPKWVNTGKHSAVTRWAARALRNTGRAPPFCELRVLASSAYNSHMRLLTLTLGLLFAACNGNVNVVDGSLQGSGGDGAHASSSGTGGSGLGSTVHSSQSTTTSASLPACTWPSSLDSPDAGQCAAARMYLNCQFPGGGGMACMSNNASYCPGNALDTSLTCVNQCNANEYAVGCGGPGPAPSPPLPGGCRGLPSGPGGGVSGCCPCGS
jgi:hypothetical protein